MTDKKNKQSNVVVFKDNILVQLTKNYHTPFKLSGEEAQTLWDGLDEALGEYKAKKVKNPFCSNCSHKREAHEGKVGKCGGGYCSCKEYDLDIEYYQPSQNMEFVMEDDDIE